MFLGKTKSLFSLVFGGKQIFFSTPAKPFSSRPVFVENAGYILNPPKLRPLEPFFAETLEHKAQAEKALKEARTLYESGQLAQAYQKAIAAIHLAEQVKGGCVATSGFHIPFYKMAIIAFDELEEVTAAPKA